MENALTTKAKVMVLRACLAMFGVWMFEHLKAWLMKRTLANLALFCEIAKFVEDRLYRFLIALLKLTLWVSF